MIDLIQFPAIFYLFLGLLYLLSVIFGIKFLKQKQLDQHSYTFWHFIVVFVPFGILYPMIYFGKNSKEKAKNKKENFIQSNVKAKETSPAPLLFNHKNTKI